ncbi:MAG: glycosyltransferase family 2 protein [Planctomycetes bacterium]|nr:glycosyltransferase family 2 protein [Planctomycetota bacterium]
MAETLFWISISLILYILPAFLGLLALRALLFPKRIRYADVMPSISVIVAVYNEEQCIAERIENLLSCDYAGEVEVLVASDGSTDGTHKIVEKYADRGVKLLVFPRQGKGQTLNRSVPHAGGEVLVFTDANTVFATDALRILARPFADTHVGGVAGNQIYTRDGTASLTADGERVYWSLDTLIKRLQSRSGNVTSATGAIYAIRKSLFQQVPPGAMDDFIISTGVIARGYRFVFEPEARAFEPVAVRGGVEFRRKRRVIMQGLRSVLHQRRLLNPFRFGFYSWQLFTHKVMRRLLWLPLLVMIAVLPLLWTHGWFYRASAVCAAGFLGLALLGRVLRPWRIGQYRILTVPFYFCMVNAAAALATVGTLFGQRVHRWEPERHTPPEADAATEIEIEITEGVSA